MGNISPFSPGNELYFNRPFPNKVQIFKNERNHANALFKGLCEKQSKSSLFSSFISKTENFFWQLWLFFELYCYYNSKKKSQRICQIMNFILFSHKCYVGFRFGCYNQNHNEYPIPDIFQVIPEWRVHI
jgi:hypothetical protein